jgi:hypothetical protein
MLACMRWCGHETLFCTQCRARAIAQLAGRGGMRARGRDRSTVWCAGALMCWDRSIAPAPHHRCCRPLPPTSVLACCVSLPRCLISRALLAAMSRTHGRVPEGVAGAVCIREAAQCHQIYLFSQTVPPHTGRSRHNTPRHTHACCLRVVRPFARCCSRVYALPRVPASTEQRKHTVASLCGWPSCPCHP